MVVVVLRPTATQPTARPLPLLTDPDEAGLAWLAALGPTAAVPPPASAPTVPTTPPDAAPVGQEKPTADDNPPLPPAAYPARLYWHVANRRGVLHRYEVRAVAQRVVLQLPRRMLRSGDVLRVHYQGYTGEYSEK